MSIELFIASSPHETKVAVLENDQLVEVYYQRDTDVGLVGGIYKGRVNRVLPGMQSAFVDIGLERDAFLHVSDLFLEDQDEYDKLFDEAEARAIRFAPDKGQQPDASVAATAPPATTVGETPPAPVAPVSSPETSTAPTAPPTATPAHSAVSPTATETFSRPPAGPAQAPARFGRGGREYQRSDRGGPRRRNRGRDFPPRTFDPIPQGGPRPSFEILPGESLAKYGHSGVPSQPAQTGQPADTAAPVADLGRAGGIAPSATSEAAALTSSSFAPEADPQTHLPAQSGVELAQPAAPAGEKGVSTPSIEPQVSAPDRPSWDTRSHFEAQPAAAGQPETVAPHAAEVPHVEEAPVSSITAGPDSATLATSETLSAPPAEPVAASATPPDMAPAETLPPPAPPAPSAPGEAPPSERTYTLREPYQQPHYAPRRGRRGRRAPMRQHGPRPEGRPESYRPPAPQRQITELLKEGQEILVQIAKEPLGTKGARVTSHIVLPGRYLVYMPTIDHIGVSRRINSEQERLRLRNTILENKGSLTGGFIVRTAGEGRSEDDLKADLKFLATLWSDIQTKAERTQAPSLIHRDLDLVQRLLRDILTPDFKCVRVDSEVEYERVVDFVNRCQPSLVGQVKLYNRDTPMFEEFGVQAEIEKALRPKVWLKSGGYIVINQTEALVAIDVNTGKYVGKTNRLEDTIVKTNIDAVQEIVRQIRLRDLGGIIVIDFIDMDERRNRLKVVQALEESLRHDRAPTKVISFHDFGLVAITRKRVKQSLERTLCEPCHYCTGAGWIKSVTTVCYEILAEARKMASQIEGSILNLRVNPEVAKTLKSREGIFVSELETLTHKEVIIRSDPAVHQERFEIF